MLPGALNSNLTFLMKIKACAVFADTELAESHSYYELQTSGFVLIIGLHTVYLGLTVVPLKR